MAPNAARKANSAPFTPEEERVLAQRMEAGRAATQTLASTPAPRGRQRAQLTRTVQDAVAARDALVTRNVPLVITIAGSYRHSGIELADLVQEGTVGLIKAVDTFDWRFGAPFSTWANRWIKQSIERNAMVYMSIIRVPVDALYDRHHLNKARDDFLIEHGRNPTLDELVEVTDLHPDRVRSLTTAPSERVEYATSGNDDAYQGLAAATEDPAQAAIDATLIAGASTALTPFNETEIRVLLLRTGAETGTSMAVKDVAETLGITTRAVHMHEQSFVAKAHHPRHAIFSGA